MRVIVTGGRDYKDRARVYAELEASGVTRLLVGDCRKGVDAFATEWSIDVLKRNDGTSSHTRGVYYADWEAFGKYAGPERNGR
jgi:hypothetical protein